MVSYTHYESHDTAFCGHFGQEKTFFTARCASVINGSNVDMGQRLGACDVPRS